METISNIAGLENIKITINTYETYSEAVLSNLPTPFTNAHQEALLDEPSVDLLIF